MSIDTQLKQYQQSNGLATELEQATPHRVIQLLLEGAIEKLVKACFFAEHKQDAKCAEHVSWAVSIIGGLHSSLNFEQGGDLAGQLDQLYDYMERTLLEFSQSKDVAKLQEVTELLRTIKDGWDQIPGDYHHVSAETPDAEKNSRRVGGHCE